MADSPTIGTSRWAREIADALTADPRFAAATQTWEGVLAVRGERTAPGVAFQIHKGSVRAVDDRIDGDETFAFVVPPAVWERLLAAGENRYMHEAMGGAFSVVGSGYEYLRMTKPLAYLVDAARQVAGVAEPAPHAPPTSVPPPAPRWSVQGSYLFLNGSLGYAEIGEPAGPARATVLLLHTAGQSGVQYRRVVPRLTALGYRTITPDYPGHGRSEPAAAGPVTDLGDFAAWLVQVIDALDPADAPLVVAGCSIGGKLTLDLATRLGSRLAGAVAMAASADAGRANRKALLRELEDVAAPSRTDRTHLGTRAVVGDAVPAEVRELIATMHRREDPVISNSDLLGWTSHDLTGRLADIRCPVLLVGGADDLWLDLEAMRRSADAIPNGRSVVLEGIGHYPPQELPDFADRLHAWIEPWLGGGDDEHAR
ncbi:alpha/beta fold hydrolase [Cumulibacter manganitolerans]|uniref:alpha/beta fold hydrolase n=1 Tax=Cumulibacter manganitolerans TaxID=1884992 RepID=UPI001E4EAFA5|nr:alpha/beta hydrolase [Cumulibacter manganitolerans]